MADRAREQGKMASGTGSGTTYNVRFLPLLWTVASYAVGLSYPVFCDTGYLNV